MFSVIDILPFILGAVVGAIFILISPLPEFFAGYTLAMCVGAMFYMMGRRDD